MGKSAPSAPPAPDPAATAAAQGAQNRETALANAEVSMIGQQGPYGSLSYAQTGTTDAGNPQYTATTTLSPEQQQLLGMQTTGQLNLGQLGLDQLGRIQASVADPFSYEGLPDAPVADDAYRTQIQEALFGRLNPSLEQDRQALETQLANSGISAGSEAYDNAYRPYNQRVNDARLAAVAQSGDEMAQMFGIQTQARQQAIQERAYARDRPLSEYSAFTAGSQPTQPTFSNTPQYNQTPADITGPTYANYQGALQNNAAQAQAAASGNAGLFGLGGAAIMGGAIMV